MKRQKNGFVWHFFVFEVIMRFLGVRLGIITDTKVRHFGAKVCHLGAKVIPKGAQSCQFDAKGNPNETADFN